MNDNECIAFLQWSLPRLRMRWAGFRKVRRQVCKRVSRRIAELGLADVPAYRAYLEANDGEWQTLDRLCRVTISRFCRDRAVYEAIGERILPRVAAAAIERGEGRVRVWSAGCASGEEPYSIQILWTSVVAPSVEGCVGLEIVATDADERLLERAMEGRYPKSVAKELPIELREKAFVEDSGALVLRNEIRRGVTFLRQDIREIRPDGRFDVVLCRNLAFTYFDEQLQVDVLNRIEQALGPGGVLVVGIHESLPPGSGKLEPLENQPNTYVKSE